MNDYIFFATEKLALTLDCKYLIIFYSTKLFRKFRKRLDNVSFVLRDVFNIRGMSVILETFLILAFTT